MMELGTLLNKFFLALTLACLHHKDYHKQFQLDSSVPKTDDSLAILQEMEKDSFFNVLYNQPRDDSLITPEFWEKVGYYASRLKIDPNPRDALKKLLHTTAVLFGATKTDDKFSSGYDFFFLHTVTSCHALAEIILNTANDNVIPPEKCHNVLVQGLWNVICFVYVCQLRPTIDVSKVTQYEIRSQGEAWKEAVELALKGLDVHFAKIVRALLFIDLYFENKDGFYAKIALNYARSFSANDRYAGFGKF